VALNRSSSVRASVEHGSSRLIRIVENIMGPRLLFHRMRRRDSKQFLATRWCRWRRGRKKGSPTGESNEQQPWPPRRHRHISIPRAAAPAKARKGARFLRRSGATALEPQRRLRDPGTGRDARARCGKASPPW
jgi:hypothetical protein